MRRRPTSLDLLSDVAAKRMYNDKTDMTEHNAGDTPLKNSSVRISDDSHCSKVKEAMMTQTIQTMKNLATIPVLLPTGAARYYFAGDVHGIPHAQMYDIDTHTEFSGFWEIHTKIPHCGAWMMEPNKFHRVRPHLPAECVILWHEKKPLEKDLQIIAIQDESEAHLKSRVCSFTDYLSDSLYSLGRRLW